MLMDGIPVVTELNLIFQKDSLNVAVFKPAVDHTISKLQYLKTNNGFYTMEFKRLICDGKELFGHELENVTQQKDMPYTTMYKVIDNLTE